MLGKLMKYEFKSTYMNFLIIYVVMFALAIAVGFAFDEALENSEAYITFLAIGGTAYGVASFCVIIGTVEKMYDDEVFGNQGYLFNTLPVTTEQLMLSKMLTLLIWAIATFFMIIISFIVGFFIIQLSTGTPILNNFFNAIKYLLTEVNFLQLILCILLIISVVVSEINLVSVIISGVNILYIQKFKKFIGYVVYVFVSGYSTKIIFSIGNNILGKAIEGNTSLVINCFLAVTTLLFMILSVGLFFGNSILIKKKASIQ